MWVYGGCFGLFNLLLAGILCGLICLVKIVLIMLVTSGGLLVVLVVGFVWW